MTATPIDRVHPRERREEEPDGERRGHHQREPQQETYRVVWGSDAPDAEQPASDTYDDHGRPTHRAEEQARLAARLRHFDATA